MDARVNDFLNEINELAPPVKTQLKPANECVWQECFDEGTGYPYYWNINTNAVTWTMPIEYQNWLDANKSSKCETSGNTKPLFPSALNSAISTHESKTILLKCVESGTHSQDIKKISALPSHLLDSDHDSLEGNTLSQNGSKTNSPLHSNRSKSNSPIVCGEGTTNAADSQEVKTTLGFSLLASYGDDSEEEEETQETPETSSPTESHSTLFPLTKPIDMKQFEEKPEEIIAQSESEEIDVKAFKRKRRIGVYLENHPKREAKAENESKSLSAENADAVKKKYSYTFVKGDTLQPTISSSENEPSKNVDDPQVDETHTVLKEKLLFLSEGREAVSPVQVMTIQLDTLYNAWKLGKLDVSYFTVWIKELGSDLVKLEEDAAPEGWNLEWDRKEKRYYYRNQATDECQWDYPQAEPAVEANADRLEDQEKVSNVEDNEDDAMDICTTPPPADAGVQRGNIEVTSISAAATDETNKDDPKKADGGNKANATTDLSSALDSFYSDIAAIETASSQSQQQQEDTKGALETQEMKTKLNALVATTQGASTTSSEAINSTGEPTKKRRKVKMSQGIAMKKKGVSQLVEKWINVQKNFD